MRFIFSGVRKSFVFIFFVGCFGILTACTSTQSYLDTVISAQTQDFQQQIIAADQFQLFTLQRRQQPNAPIRIYIEGDGQAWRTRFIPSTDPTPSEPLALQLAMRDVAPNVIYLARPCQYVMSAACKQNIWTNARYGDAVIESMVDAIKQMVGPQPVELIGYSGGGTIALLVAAQLPNVASVRTVAGNLDPAAHIVLHELAPLIDSHSPAEFAERLAHIPQVHFVGAEDDNVPHIIAESYQQTLNNTQCSKIINVPKATHNSGWQEVWPQLLKIVPGCHSEQIGERLPSNPAILRR